MAFDLCSAQEIQSHSIVASAVAAANARPAHQWRGCAGRYGSRTLTPAVLAARRSSSANLGSRRVNSVTRVPF
jgi:hypothetical protein